jgi:hypothetical protein
MPPRSSSGMLCPVRRSCLLLVVVAGYAVVLWPSLADGFLGGGAVLRQMSMASRLVLLGHSADLSSKVVKIVLVLVGLPLVSAASS